MFPGQSLTVRCDNAAELDSTYRTAVYGKKVKESDHIEVKVVRSAVEMTVRIDVEEKKGGEV